MPELTADEFERFYVSEGRDMTREQIDDAVAETRAAGRVVAPCACGEDRCQGWQSTTLERLNERASLIGEPAWSEARLAAAIEDWEAAP
jgi:hypothetical protein